MAFLTINGVDYDVLEGGASAPAGEPIGEEVRAIDFSLRSSVQGEKRAYRFKLVPLTPDAFAVLEAITRAGDIVPCAGDAIEATDYRVRMENADYARTDLTFLRAPDISLRQA